jgi:hypothetical protein
LTDRKTLEPTAGIMGFGGRWAFIICTEN